MVAKLRNNLGYVFLAVGVAALACTLGKYDQSRTVLAWDPSVTGTVLAELLIAAVIYYEIEENRVAKFLDDALGSSYARRSHIYQEYMQVSGVTWEERAESFRQKIWADLQLRKEVDFQITYFSHAHYLVRSSLLHRGLLKEWFPQVIVRMWAMCSAYAKDSERRGIRAAGELAKEVVGSVDAMLTTGNFLPLSIHSVDGKRILTLERKDLEHIKQDALSYLAQ
jgi:hypothetical protein